MKIFNPSGTEILDVLVDDSSVRYRSIMNDDSLTLNFSLTESVEIPLYSYVVFEGARYTLWRPEEFKKNGTRNHEYTLTLHGYREFLKFVKFKDTSSKPYRLKFFLTGKPVDFMNMLVDSLNDKDGGWTVGSCIDASEKTLSFNHEYCLDVLARLATEFNTEYEFEGKKIHLRKVEKFKDDPLPLSYGKGNGFLPGVGRYNDGDKQPIGRLYVQGGERNIDFSTYGSTTLLLPKSAILEYGGKTYRTDADGMYITRDGNNNTAEDSFDAGGIYPSRVGTVTAVEVIDAEKNFYDIIDSTIPEALDYGNCRIAGEKATIVFQTGALAGREFDIEQTDDAMTGYVHDERRFKIVPAELDGIVMPGGVFVPTVGDKYVVFNIRMPEAYISDNATKTGASWDMFREAVKYFAENEEDKFRFTGQLDGIWSKSRWLEIGGKIVPGGHVLFSDIQFQPQGVLIRIIAVKDYVNKPHKPEITLGNASVSGSFSAELGKLEADEVVIEESKKESIRFTKRQWRDARETISMLEQSLLRFSGSISPITVQTMQLLVGDESLQFRFVNSKTNPQVVAHNVVFNQETKVLTSDSGILQHMTLGISTIRKTHAASEYTYWDIAAYTSPALDPDKPYYLYAKCAKSGTTGTFLLSETAVGMESVSDYYHFLVGILNSEQDGDRSFARMYGFTEILPGQITTDRIVSTDGKTYFDLVSGIIGGRIKFISTSDTEEDLGVWAGETENSIIAEEQRAIADAQAKLDAARAYADAQDALLKTQQEAYADGVATAAEAAAIAEAQAYADLKKVEAQAYADGIVDAEEQRAIADAQAKLDAARAYADAQVDAVEAIASDALAKAEETDYLKQALKQDTDVDGGLILSSILATRDANGVVRSYQSGDPEQNSAAFAAGVENFGTPSEKKVVEICHNGTGKIGIFVIDNLGNIKIYDSSEPSVIRLLFSKYTLPLLQSLLDENIYGGSVTNPESIGATSGTTILPNKLIVTQPGAEIHFTGVASISGYLAPGYASGKIEVTIKIVNENTGELIYSFSDGRVLDYRYESSYYNSSGINKIIYNVDAGIYRVEISRIRINADDFSAGLLGQSTLTWSFSKDVRRFEFAKNGFMAFYQNNHMYFSENGGLDVRGATNIPGALLSATVASIGGWSNVWGAKTSDTPPYNNSTGRYTVYHTVGHSKYQIFAIALTSNKSCYIVSKSDTNFVIEWRTIGSSPTLVNTAFDFQIVGNNYS
jgi:hypothetical protein